MFPVFCVSAKNNIGVDRLMEFIVNEAPSIADMPAPVNNKGMKLNQILQDQLQFMYLNHQ